MNMIRVAINGYGRIGRVSHRIILEKFSSGIDVVAINVGSSTDLNGWMNLLKYDSIYRPLSNHTISTQEKIENSQIGFFIIDGKQIPVFCQKDPSLLPWKDLSVDVVLECTGKLKTKEALDGHIKAGAKKVVLSAPAKNSDIVTYVLSVNANTYQGETIVSNASCTTNCVAPVANIMETHFGIEKAMMTTIHGYTSDQNLLDGGHKDYRRARAGAINIIPTSTGATKATAQTIPALKDTFGGLAIRVPVPTGSLCDFTMVVKKETTREEINAVFTQEANNPVYTGIVAVTNDPLVSSDIIGNAHSAIVDLSLTQVVGGNLVKVIAWYDNEWGYANRLVEEALLVGGQQ
jgi:glyceraldehyde 3-phosphate dehydrogenase